MFQSKLRQHIIQSCVFPRHFCGPLKKTFSLQPLSAFQLFTSSLQRSALWVKPSRLSKNPAAFTLRDAISVFSPHCHHPHPLPLFQSRICFVVTCSSFIALDRSCTLCSRRLTRPVKTSATPPDSALPAHTSLMQFSLIYKIQDEPLQGR